MKLFCLWLCLGATLLHLYSGTSTYSEVYASYCTPEILTAFEITEEERVNLRSSGTPLSLDTNVLQDIITNSKISKAFSQIGAPVMLMAILLIFCLISFIVYLSFCCCCDRASSAAKKTAQICGGISALLLLIYMGFFIASMVYVSRVNSANKSAYCFLASLTKDLLEGVLTPEFQFVGFNNLTTILTSFQTEIASIAAVANDFDAINAKNIPAQTKAALNSLPTFYSKYKDSTTSDGAGAKSRPLTVQNLTANINDFIYTEFQIYDQAANQITQAAQIGKQYVQNNSIKDAQNSIAAIIIEIKDIADKIGIFFTDAESAVAYYRLSNGISFGFKLGEGILCLVLGIASLLLIGFMIKNENNKGRIAIKVFLCLLGFLAFVLAIASLVVLCLSATVGSSCKILAAFMSTTNPTAELAKYNLTADGLVSSVLNECMPIGASGNLTNFFTNGTSIFNSSQQFIDGLAVYQTLKDNLTTYGDYSPSINATVAIWNQFKTSVYPDQTNAIASLAQFNELIKCNGIYYQLNSKTCPDITSCKGIYDTASFSAPSCSANPSSANSLFLNLKAFTTDEDKLLGDMVNDLQGNNPSTPLSLNAQARTSLKSVVPALDNIQKKLTNTVSLASTFADGFSRSVNCTIIRRELNNLESSLCFDLNKNFYYYAVVGSFQVCFLFLFCWMLCFTLRYVPKDYDPVYIEAPHNQTTYSVNDPPHSINDSYQQNLVYGNSLNMNNDQTQIGYGATATQDQNYYEVAPNEEHAPLYYGHQPENDPKSTFY